MYPREKLPKYDQLPWPVVLAHRESGGSITKNELHDKVLGIVGLPEEVLEIHKISTGYPVIYDRIDWARSYLKMMGVIEYVAPAVSSLTPIGNTIKESDFKTQFEAFIKEKRREYYLAQKRNRKASKDEPAATQDAEIEGRGETSWRETLLETLKTMDPIAFERLCQRVLRSSGFEDVEVTARSGDGGIDGFGTLVVNHLVSYRVAFQCKRYKERVGPDVVQQFRGALASKAEKGLILTTGSFTRGAKDAAEIIPTIQLADGDALCDLLKKFNIGVSTRMVEEVVVDKDFFSGV